MKKYEYIGNCGDSFDEEGNSLIAPFRDVSDFAVKDENAQKITREEFELFVKKIPLGIRRRISNHKTEYLFYDGNIFVIYDVKDDMHYFFA